MKEFSPIFVTGAARSGSGMIAGTFVKCGAFGGVMTNKRGMYENDRIRDEIVKPYLRKVRADVAGQYPLPDIDSVFIPRLWQSQVEKVILEQGYPFDVPWMYKDSRIALTWPIWHYAFPNAKWILVRRRTGDIIESCIKTAYMKAFKETSIQQRIDVESEEAGWLWWVHQYEKRFVEMIEAGVNVKIIWPERMVHGDYQQLFETLDWLGLKWTPEILNFIDPLLWTSRNKERRV
jgi:hypothetical protein